MCSEKKMRFKKHNISTLPVQKLDIEQRMVQTGSGRMQRSHGDGGNANRKWRHSPTFPQFHLRMLIIGRSGAGKTNALIRMIEHPNGLTFENLYIYSKTLHQPKYEYLKRILGEIKGIGYYEFSSRDETMPPNEVKPNSIYIFDDIQCNKENIGHIKDYFTMGRHFGVDVIMLSQCYTSIPKHMIRENANFLMLFKQDARNLYHIFNDCMIGCDMTFREFLDFCHACWGADNEYGFAIISPESPSNGGKYRKGFDLYLQFPLNETDDTVHREKKKPSFSY